jgi:hypothetical protein
MYRDSQSTGQNGASYQKKGKVTINENVNCLQVPNTLQQALYVTGRVQGPAGAQIMLELRMIPGQPGIDASFKSEKDDLAQLAFQAVISILGSF